MTFETENIEFKLQFTDELYKEVIAFANTDGDTFESMRSMEQDLTFKSAKEAFKRYNIEFSKTKYRTLGITTQADELYSNLALIISDQCAHTTKVAVFADKKMEFISIGGLLPGLSPDDIRSGISQPKKSRWCSL